MIVKDVLPGAHAHCCRIEWIIRKMEKIGAIGEFFLMNHQWTSRRKSAVHLGVSSVPNQLMHLHRASAPPLLRTCFLPATIPALLFMRSIAYTRNTFALTFRQLPRTCFSTTMLFDVGYSSFVLRL